MHSNTIHLDVLVLQKVSTCSMNKFVSYCGKWSFVLMWNVYIG